MGLVDSFIAAEFQQSKLGQKNIEKFPLISSSEMSLCRVSGRIPGKRMTYRHCDVTISYLSMDAPDYDFGPLVEGSSVIR